METTKNRNKHELQSKDSKSKSNLISTGLLVLLGLGAAVLVSNSSEDTRSSEDLRIQDLLENYYGKVNSRFIYTLNGINYLIINDSVDYDGMLNLRIYTVKFKEESHIPSKDYNYIATIRKDAYTLLNNSFDKFAIPAEVKNAYNKHVESCIKIEQESTKGNS